MSVFQIIHHLNCQKWQTVAARLSVQNIRQDKPQIGAKYSCKTGLFHRFPPGNKISKIWAWTHLCLKLSMKELSVFFLSDEGLLKLYQASVN